MTNPLFNRLRHIIQQPSTPAASKSAHTSASHEAYAWLQDASEGSIHQTLEILFESPAEVWDTEAAEMASIWVELVHRQHSNPVDISTAHVGQFATAYAQSNTRAAIKAMLLRFLIATSSPSALKTFAKLLVAQPIEEPRLLVEIFSDLIRHGGDSTAEVFPQLMLGLRNRHLATFVLDFANYVFRQRRCEVHPAAAEVQQLSELLSGIAGRLGKLQETRPESPEEVTSIGRQVTESVSLGISLCDAIGLIGNPATIPSLHKTLEVEHRRLRVEAAAALARMGEPDGGKLLTAMAAEPAERIRVLAYAEELDLIGDIDEEFSNPVARAEAEFVMHLTEPVQFGMAPQHIELVDERTLSWPGYEEPRNCYLFQYVYPFPAGEITNIGIAGPVVFTFQADLTPLALEDVYALFAGWHVQHPDIFAVEPDRVVGQDEVEFHRLVSTLREAEAYDDIVPALLGHFLGRRVLVASAQRENDYGWAIVSDDAYLWLPLGSAERPLGAEEAFYVFVGRALLASFN